MELVEEEDDFGWRLYVNVDGEDGKSRHAVVQFFQHRSAYMMIQSMRELCDKLEEEIT